MSDGTMRVLRPQQRRLLTLLVGRARERGGAWLVHAGAVVSTDRLLAVLWGDELPATALKSLHTHIARLRSTFGVKASVCW